MNTPNAYAPPKAAVADIVVDGGNNVLASRGARLGAFVLDLAIAYAIVIIPLIFTGALAGISGAVTRNDPGALVGIILGMGGLSILALFVVWAVVTLIFVASNGQTIGKKIVGIKVVRSNGAKASLGRIFWLRNVVNGIIAMFLPFIYFYVIDPLFIFGERQQCLHDMIADTSVVNA
jgi:uncharacterized RDD family membrane protein YckC